VATVTLVASTPNAATFNVTGILSGKATINVTDTLGGGGVVSVGVGQAPLAAKRHSSYTPQPAQASQPSTTGVLPIPEPQTAVATPMAAQVSGTLFANTQGLVFARSGISQVLSVSEEGYRGVIVATSSDPNVADVRQGVGSGDIRTIVVVSRGPGRAQIRIIDDRGRQITVAVTVLSEPSRLSPPNR
jgi:hypothetical protein